MQTYASLRVQNSNRPDTILRFGVLTEQHELDAMYAQRFRVYLKYNYIEEKEFPEGRESDSFDGEQCVYLGAYNGDRLIGSLRLIRPTANRLPMEKFFSFSKDSYLEHLVNPKIGEIGRLVVERTPNDDAVPRNIVMLLLSSGVLDAAKDLGLDVAYAYLTHSLATKLSLLRVPYNRLSYTECQYPDNGPMYKYFYNTDKPIIPAYFKVESASDYFEKFLQTMLQVNKDGGGTENGEEYILKNTIYTRMLKQMKIL